MSRVENLLLHLKEYATLRIRLAELKASSKGSLLASSLVTIIILFIFGFFFVLLFSIGIAFLIGSYLGEWYWGFLLVAAFYLVVGIACFAFKNKWIRRPLNDLIIKEMFDED